MYGSLQTNSLNITKIIGGLSKSLNIVNQVIPIYKEMKPIITNAGSILSVFKEMTKEDKSLQNNTVLKEDKISLINNNDEKKEGIINNTLTFFQ